jgi:hypothetical protein
MTFRSLFVTDSALDRLHSLPIAGPVAFQGFRSAAAPGE